MIDPISTRYRTKMKIKDPDRVPREEVWINKPLIQDEHMLRAIRAAATEDWTMHRSTRIKLGPAEQRPDGINYPCIHPHVAGFSGQIGFDY